MAYNKVYYHENKERIRKQQAKYREANYDKIREKEKEYQRKNKVELNKKNKQYYHDNVDKILEQRRNSQNIKSYARSYIKIKYNSDPQFREQCSIKRKLNKAYRRYEASDWTKCPKSISGNKYMDYQAIFDYLGPCPGEYGRGNGYYTIDHIVPLTTLNLLEPLDYKIATHPMNHRWLRSNDNYRRRWQDDDDVVKFWYDKIKKLIVE